MSNWSKASFVLMLLTGEGLERPGDQPENILVGPSMILVWTSIPKYLDRRGGEFVVGGGVLCKSEWHNSSGAMQTRYENKW
jgi:hypothetical protein